MVITTVLLEEPIAVFLPNSRRVYSNVAIGCSGSNFCTNSCAVNASAMILRTSSVVSAVRFASLAATSGDLIRTAYVAYSCNVSNSQVILVYPFSGPSFELLG